MSDPGNGPVDISPRAVVGPDGGAELVIDGTVHRFTGVSAGEAGGLVTQFMARRAADEGRVLALSIEDPDGEWLLSIHPDGTVDEAGSPPPERRGRRSAGSETERDADRAAAPDVEPEPRTESDPEPDEQYHEREADYEVPDDRAVTESTAPLRAVSNPFPPRFPTVATPADHHELPTLDDLLATRPEPPVGPAEWGWRRTLRHLTFGIVAPAPGRVERHHRDAIVAVQRSLDGPKTVVVLNPKGGAHKTTAALLIAATFGIHRGGYTLAWDNNETRGTLGWRSAHARHANTAVTLLRDLGRFTDLGSARVGDLDNYVRSQGSAQFDVLASDEDAASAASIDAEAFTALHRTLVRFYRVMVIDTGNNMRASNWQAAINAADQLVIVSTIREDTAQSAAWAIDALRASGHEDLVSRAVTVLSAPAADVDAKLRARLHHHFGQLTRVVIDVPHDPALVAGGPLLIEALQGSTREAWLQVTSAVAEGL
ncbi:MinD/ParA family ATP-binding protein [Pengzhenrongella frigida]|uniref:Chromosome partitioning protein n=1 Tax=Pengzhenrongella frigida TaxID=1259133 RepID=A0A4V1ZHC2_9MICO|nr:chromosome partitioning protein [Cellulomonas sp. HLT2-17]RYV51534.1 chromosome partitioning protein [Cellulomonas sp. HLT2-17]